jgi:hypothetical protein
MYFVSSSIHKSNPKIHKIRVNHSNLTGGVLTYDVSAPFYLPDFERESGYILCIERGDDETERERRSDATYARRRGLLKKGEGQHSELNNGRAGNTKRGGFSCRSWW